MKVRTAKKILTMKSSLWEKPHVLDKARKTMRNKKGWIILPKSNIKNKNNERNT
jgi:hypothetical protein